MEGSNAEVQDSISEPESPEIEQKGWIPNEKLTSFGEYKYISPTITYFESQILDRFWTCLIKYMPMSIAPNLITVSGFIIVIIPLFLMLWEDPTMTEQVATWKYFLFAVAIWVYQTLDSLDGKQARRTGSSSPLGELFDHGIDAVVCLLLAIMYCHVMAYGASFYTSVGILFQLGIFAMFTFEKRFTYILRTAIGEFGA